MSSTIEIKFSDLQVEQEEILIAHLAELGFDAFEEEGGNLKAFIKEGKLERSLLEEICFKYNVRFEEKLIPTQNWNRSWESSFNPVIVGNFAGIRADFHAPVKGVQYDIQITPKMSFGTGHHATTCLVIEQMRSLEFTGKSVLDFGTGTGILAILAEKMGAEKIMAIDNDDWSIKNAEENMLKNGCRRIELKLEDSLEKTDRRFDIILANINLNVLLDNLPAIASHSNRGAAILLSGILLQDEEEIRSAARANSLIVSERTENNGWICLKLIR